MLVGQSEFCGGFGEGDGGALLTEVAVRFFGFILDGGIRSRLRRRETFCRGRRLRTAVGLSVLLCGIYLTISADITFGQVSSERQENLKKWGFKCTCDLCAASSDEVAASDERREKIAALKQQAIEAFQAGKVYMSLKLTRQILPLLPEEDMFQEMADQYENMARIYYVMRDRKNAAKWARKSLEALVEQGYLKLVREEDVGRMFARFEEDEGGRY